MENFPFKISVNTQPTAVNFETLPVEVRQSISERLAKYYAEAINLAFARLARDISVSSDQVRRYFNLLVSLRVKYVSGEGYPRYADSLNIPTLFSLALSHLGVATDTALGFRLIPKLSSDMQWEVMEKEEAMEFSDTLAFAEMGGLKLVQRLPRDSNGNVEMMYFTWIEGNCLAHTNNLSVAAAAMSSFFDLNRTSSILNPRVSYGYSDELETALREIIINN